MGRQAHPSGDKPAPDTMNPTTLMPVLVAVKQAESIRRGIAAPTSTVTLPLDVAGLDPDTRRWVADRYRDGELRRRLSYAERLSVPQPDAAGLHEAIGRAMQQDADEADKPNQQIREWLRLPVAERIYSSYIPQGAATEPAFSRHAWYGVSCDTAHRAVTDPASFAADIRDLIPPAIEEVRAYILPIWQERRADYLAKQEAEVAQRKAETDAAAAALARRKAQLDAAAAAHGGILAERHRDGYTTDAEIIALICAAERKARGVELLTTQLGREKCQVWFRPLSDPQYLALKAFKAKLPEDAEVTLRNAWDTEEDEDGDDVTVNDTIYARAEWMVGEFTVIARQDLGEPYQS